MVRDAAFEGRCLECIRGKTPEDPAGRVAILEHNNPSPAGLAGGNRGLVDLNLEKQRNNVKEKNARP